MKTPKLFRYGLAFTIIAFMQSHLPALAQAEATKTFVVTAEIVESGASRYARDVAPSMASAPCSRHRLMAMS